jgi:hypothetical protein
MLRILATNDPQRDMGAGKWLLTGWLRPLSVVVLLENAGMRWTTYHGHGRRGKTPNHFKFGVFLLSQTVEKNSPSICLLTKDLRISLLPVITKKSASDARSALKTERDMNTFNRVQILPRLENGYAQVV